MKKRYVAWESCRRADTFTTSDARHAAIEYHLTYSDRHDPCKDGSAVFVLTEDEWNERISTSPYDYLTWTKEWEDFEATLEPFRFAYVLTLNGEPL